MTMFDDRERAFETKFGMDQEAAFRVTVRRDKLLGLWAAGEMGLAGDAAAAYAKTLVEAELEHQDVVRKVMADLHAGGVDLDEPALRRRLAALEEEARSQVAAEVRPK